MLSVKKYFVKYRKAKPVLPIRSKSLMTPYFTYHGVGDSTKETASIKKKVVVTEMTTFCQLVSK